MSTKVDTGRNAAQPRIHSLATLTISHNLTAFPSLTTLAHEHAARHAVCPLVMLQSAKGTDKTMKTTKNILIAGALLATAGLSGTANAADISVQLNGQPLATSTAPVQMNGRTLVPLRDIFEALGANVQWNPAAQTILATRGQTQIGLAINNRNATVNGKTVVLDQAATLLNGRTLVPLRFVAEATGATVNWNPALQQVSIGTPQTYNPTIPVGTTNPNTLPNYGLPAPTNTGSQVANYRQISIPAGVVIPVTLDQTLNSALTRVGSTFTASTKSVRLGDSEFPAGTKIEGRVTEARPSQNNKPGVLDMEWTAALLPDGTRVPLSGQLTSLDTDNVSNQGGRLVASGARKDDRLKVIGIGAGAGFVLGRVLDTNSTVSTILGAAGGYLFSRSRDKKAEEARLAQNTTLGVELTQAARYTDTTDYGRFRDPYLRDVNTRFNPQDYGYDQSTSVRPSDNYDGYQVTNTLPNPVYDANGQIALNPPIPTNNNVFGDNQTVAGARQISIPAGAVVPVKLNVSLSSATARVGQEFTATVDSQQLGDSEFPAGTTLLGRVVEARRMQGNEPGVLDFDFTTAILPGGERVGLRGDLTTLDDKSVQTEGGRIIAKAGNDGGDKLKVIGIGTAAGFVIGRVLKKDGIVPSLLGALGGYIFSQSKGDKPSEAQVAAGSRIGVRLNQRVAYNDDSYYGYRDAYLRLN